MAALYSEWFRKRSFKRWLYKNREILLNANTIDLDDIKYLSHMLNEFSIWEKTDNIKNLVTIHAGFQSLTKFNQIISKVNTTLNRKDISLFSINIYPDDYSAFTWLSIRDKSYNSIEENLKSFIDSQTNLLNKLNDEDDDYSYKLRFLNPLLKEICSIDIFLATSLLFN